MLNHVIYAFNVFIQWLIALNLKFIKYYQKSEAIHITQWHDSETRKEKFRTPCEKCE